MMDWETHRRELLKDPKIRKALKKNALEYQIARAIIKARIEKGLTQNQLAQRMKTKQSVISRLENFDTVPSLSSLKRYADALGATLQIQFCF